jgi:hypothetical protein
MMARRNNLLLSHVLCHAEEQHGCALQVFRVVAERAKRLAGRFFLFSWPKRPFGLKMLRAFQLAVILLVVRLTAVLLCPADVFSFAAKAYSKTADCK